MLSADWIRKMALASGFSVCGLARSRALDERREGFGAWLGEGLHDGLRYLERNLDKRFDPGTLVAGAKTVIVCAASYNNEAWRVSCAAEIAAAEGSYDPSAATQGTPQNPHAAVLDEQKNLSAATQGELPNFPAITSDRSPNLPAEILCGTQSPHAAATAHVTRVPFPKVASYALAEDYHVTVKAMLRSLLGKIQERYPGVRGRCFTDSAPLLEKSWAVEAGLGWIGKNSLLISPRFGSFILLGELVIDAETDDYDEPYTRDGCGTCRRCLDACPNGAIVAPRRIDLRRCIPHLTIERPVAAFSDDRQSSVATFSDDRKPPVSAFAEKHETLLADAPPLHGWIFGCDICQAVCPYNRHAPRYTNPVFTPLYDPAQITAEQWKSDNPRKPSFPACK